MSSLLSELTGRKITVAQALEKLLVIASLSGDQKVANWCNDEIQGYKDIKNVPEYRKIKDGNILYSGFIGNIQVTNQPLQRGYLSEETWKSVSDLAIFDSIGTIEKLKDEEHPIYRDLTPLSGEVMRRTEKNDPLGIGVQCVNIKQIVSPTSYENIYSAVRTRVINILCCYEKAGIDADQLESTKERVKSANLVYETIVEEGKISTYGKRENKLLWKILVPILTGVVVGLITFFLTKYFS